MLCQNCHTNDAGIHLRRIINGESAELHLCADCARALGYGNIFTGFAFPARRGEALSGADFSAIGNRVVHCEVCGFSFDDIVRSSRPGCPNCYRVFADKLLPSIQKMHGRALYQGDPAGKAEGKAPAPSGEKWYLETPNHSDIVLGSAVRLTANVDGVPFPARLSLAQRDALNGRISEALGPVAENLTFVDPGSLYPYEAVSLAERNLITPEFAAVREGTLLAFSPDEKLSLMLGEGDHLKIRAAVSGLSPEAAFSAAGAVREQIHRAMPLAVSPKLGFLNQSPSDLGTGMVSSVLMHLPVLSKTGGIPALSSIVSKLGLSVSGVNFAGQGVEGDMYLISNTLTMGLSEAEALSNLKAICLQIETRERAAAEAYVQDIAVRDRIQRASSVLSGAVLLTSREMNEMLSWIRLGSVYGLCSFSLPVINELFFTLQPASVNTVAGARIPAPARDELRAKLVRRRLFE